MGFCICKASPSSNLNSELPKVRNRIDCLSRALCPSAASQHQEFAEAALVEVWAAGQNKVLKNVITGPKGAIYSGELRFKNFDDAQRSLRDPKSC